MLSDVGIGPSVVQNKRGGEPEFLNTAFTVLACLLAWPTAWYLEVPALAYLIPVVSTSLLVGGFMNAVYWSAMRSMKLRPITAINIAAEIVGVGVTVAWASASPTIWSLIAGTIATAVSVTLGTYLLKGKRSRFGWDKAAAGALLHFGIGTFLSTATWFVASQGERFVLTKQLAIQKTHAVLDSMGDYGVAAMLSMTAATAVSQVISQAIFPSISRAMQESPEVAIRQYRKARWLTLGLVLAVTVPLAAGGEWIVHLLLSDKWHEAGWMVRILAVRGAFEMAQTLPAVLLMAHARLKFAVIANSVRAALMFVVVPAALAAGGLREVVWALSLLAIPTYAVFIFGLWRTVPSLVKGEVVVLLVLLAGSAACTWPLLHAGT
jgi:O-antigen/teichoic acid export membrane protein